MVNRTGLHRPVLMKTSIYADRFFRTQADPGQWSRGSAQPATVPDVRLHEVILRLRDLTGDSVSETITADLLWRCPGPGDFSRPGGTAGPGYYPADKVAVVFAPDTVSAPERDGYSHPHDHPQARRRSAPPPGGDPLPAPRSRPLPLVVLSHGTSRNPQQRGGERCRYDAQSWEFVSMGFAVVIPMRRGYGHSEGDYAEAEGLCDHSRFYEAGLESARDLQATVAYVSALPGIDPQRLVLAGHSSGGFASLILASQGLPGVRGVINFAGGRGSKVSQNCSPDKLIEACGLAGRTTRVPTLWLYAQNDSYFPPQLAREMSAAFRQAGGQVELVMLPPFGEEGHYLFTDVRGLVRWTPVVNRFLNDLGFPGTMPRP